MESTIRLEREVADLMADGMPARRLEALFDAHHQRLYRLARRMSGDPEEARDLVQQAFLRAAARPGAIPAGEPAGEAWLVRVVVNLCRDRHRRRQVRRRTVVSPADAIDPGPEAAAMARDQVQAALAGLSSRRRAIVVMHEIEERDCGEIARLLGITRVTVRWHLAAGRRELRALLLNREIEDEEPN
jgi:RNA polymerase sigma factor (sigma-70 family)